MGGRATIQELQAENERLRRELSNALRRAAALPHETEAASAAAQQALRESEERFRLAHEALEGLVYDWDVSNDRMYRSAGLARLIGFHPEEAPPSAQWLLDRVQPEDRMAVRREFERAAAARQAVFSAEYRVRHRDGRWVWVSDNSRLFYDGQGRLARMIGCVGDITERKRAEAALRESEERYSLLAEAIPQPVWRCDAQGGLIECNRRWYEYTGQTPDEACGDGWMKAIHAEDVARVTRQVQVALVGGGIFQTEYRLRRASDGTYRWHLARAIPRRDATGAIVGWFGTAADIEDHKRAEQELAASKAVLQAAIDSLPFDFWALDAQNRYILQNAVSRRYWGEFVGKRPQDVARDEENLSLWLDNNRRAFAGEKVAGEVELKIAGQRRHHYNVVAPIWQEGQVRGILGVNVDISDRKQAEEELVTARDAAEAASRAKSQFLANISHEIRTPMTAVLGFAELLAGMDCSAEEQRKFLHIIQQSGTALLQLIDDILDLSKIEASRASLELVPCSPRSIVEEVILLLKVRAEEKRLELQAHYHAPLPALISTDPVRLRQILLNLLGNAIKFTAAGHVRIDVSYLDQQRPMMRFAVADTGIGIGRDHLEEIFQPFSQADASTTRRFGGTGLGLTISRRLAEALGGQLTVESALRKGSTFTLAIDAGPVARASLVPSFGPDAAAPPAAARARRRLAGKVLLVEDTPANRHLVEAVLSKAGLDLDMTENGEEACRMAAASARAGKAYDLILMDMQLPGIDGYEAVRRLRRESWAGPIVAITAHAMARDREACLAAGCDEYLAKPVGREKLLDVLSRFLHVAN